MRVLKPQQSYLTAALIGRSIPAPALRSVVASAPTTAPRKAGFCVSSEDAMGKRDNYKTDEYRAWNRERMRRYREQHPDRVRASVRKYRGAHREESREYARKNRAKQRKWWANNPGYLAAYRRKNRERMRVHNQRWAAKNLDKIRIKCQRRRALKSSSDGSYTLLEWQALCRKYDFRCLACGKRAPDIQLTVDHVIPLDKGGSNYIDNLQPLCLECNSAKGTQIIDYRPDRTERLQVEQLSLW